MRRLLVGAAAVAVLAALVALFYSPLIFQGLILGDYDAFVYFYPLRQYAAESLLQGRFPLWNPYLFLGSPFFANVQTAVLYPLNALFLYLPIPYAYTASLLGHLLLAGLAMYIFSRRTLGVSFLPALLAATSFTFSGFLLNQVGHINQLNVSVWLPLLLVAFDEAIRRRSLALAIATGLVGALQLLAGHTQEWYFSMVALGCLGLWRVMVPATIGVQALKEGRAIRRLRPLVYLTVAGVVEAGLTAVQLLPSFELSRESIRGGGMAYHEVVSFSLPPTTLLYTILSTYPSELFSEFVGYVGVVPVVLAILAVIAWMARPVTAFMAFLTGLGLFMAMGQFNPLYPRLFDLVPGLDLFRVPARWLLVYTFGICGLAGLGAQLVHDLAHRPALNRRSWGEKAPRLLGFLGGNLVLGAAVFVFYFAYQWAMPQPRYEDIEVWVTLAALTLALVAMGSLGRRAGWVSLGLLLAVTSGELWLAGESSSLRHPIPYEAYRPERASTSALLQDAASTENPGRLLTFATDRYEVKETPDYKRDYAWLHPDALIQFMVNVKLGEVLAANLPMEYGIEMVDGYDGGILPLRRFAELKSLLLPSSGIPADNQLRLHLLYAPPSHLLDLMNVRYILHGKIQDARIDNVYYDRAFSLMVGHDERVRLQRMPDLNVTSVGVISSIEGARDQAQGTVAAVLRVTDSYGATYPIPLRLGYETGETPEQDDHSGPAAHMKPLLVPSWTPEEQSTEYFAKISLPNRNRIKEITVQNTLEGSRTRIRAITLIDDAGGDSYPLVLSDQIDRQSFFDMKLYSRRDLLPRAYLVSRTAVRDDSLALEMLRAPDLPLDQLAVLSPSATARAIYRAADVRYEPLEASIRSYRPEEVVVDVRAGHDAYLVLSDVYYPGWKAFVDGVETPIERANYLFRGVLVDEGSHTVVFRYEPQSFQAGLRISLASIAFVLLALLILGADHWRRSRATVL